MARRRNKQAERAIARRRIRHLLEAARRRLREGEQGHSRRAVSLARRLAMRYQTGLRPQERDQVCRECSSLLLPGKNARVRLRAGMKRITCLECGNTQRRGYQKEQKARRLTRQRERQEQETPLVTQIPQKPGSR
jgi:ribonuclease P protein subunit RPR2